MLLFFTVGGFFLLRSLAQDHGALELKVILESVVSVYWEIGRSVLAGFVCWSVVSSCPSASPPSASSFVLLLLSPPWLAPRNRRVHLAVFFSSLSLSTT